MAIPITHQVVFGNNIINQIAGVSVYSLDPYVLPSRTLNSFPVARQSGQKVASGFYISRVINMGVYIQAATKAAAEAVLDNLWSQLQGQEQSLIIPQSGTVRQYTATLTGQPKFNKVSGGFMDIVIAFQCSDSFGYDTTYTTILNSTLASGNISTQYTQGGGADTQVPFIQVQYTALTGATSKAVTVTNPANGQACVITRTWGVNDILQIDSRNKTVQVNGVDVIFTGAIPEWGIGLQKVNITDAFTTRTGKHLQFVYNRWN